MSTMRIMRKDPSSPILFTTGRTGVGIKAGTIIEVDGVSHTFDVDTPVATIGDLVSGSDYGVGIGADSAPFAGLTGEASPIEAGFFAGFHFAPGGCAEARAGGDAIPAVNPHSLWDVGFCPTCPDPRGMVLVETDGRRFWADIYLLGTDHLKQGTSRCGAEIADGRSLDLLDYPTATAIYADHGKRLMTYDEFRDAAFGVTEKSSAERDPKKTGVDPARTSRIGLMQATGNLWVWGTDGDQDDPRPSIFGGSWVNGSRACSRIASLGYWPGGSGEGISARGACDHLSPV